MMSVYDKLGSKYDSHRSDVGARDVLGLVNEMGGSLNVLDLGCGTGHPIAIQVAPV